MQQNKKLQEKITIIVPIYNVEKYLEECIKSIISQTYNNLEILLIDDGSTDDSAKICIKFEKQDKRIKYIYQNNSGVSVARNIGIKLAKGKYIAFVDGDDSLEQDMISSLYNLIINCQYPLVMCGHYLYDSHQKQEQYIFSKSEMIDTNKRKKEILTKINYSLGVPWGKLYKKNFLIDNKIFFKENLKRMQDTIFNLEVFELCGKFMYLKKPLYNYRFSQNSACNKFSPDFDDTSNKVLQSLKEYLQKYNLWEDYKYIYYTKEFTLYMELIRLKYVQELCHINYFQKIKEIRQKKFNYDLIDLNSMISKKDKLAYFLLKIRFVNLCYLLYKIDYITKRRKTFK